MEKIIEINFRNCYNECFEQEKIKIHTKEQIQLLKLLADLKVLEFECSSEDKIYDTDEYNENI